MYFHFLSDAGLGSGTQSLTGGVGRLAGGPWAIVMLRQHLASPFSHAAEVVAAGTNLTTIAHGNAWLQENHIRQGKPTPMYLDSISTVFVAKGTTGVKKSVWLVRRTAVLHEAVEHGEIIPLHIPDAYMLADIFTKYLKYTVWRLHVKRIHNVPIDIMHDHAATAKL